MSPEPQKPHVAAGPRYDPPPPGRTTHRYSDIDEHPVSECSPERCGALEGDFGFHLREDCPDTGICVRHAVT